MRETNHYLVDAATLRATGVVALLGTGVIHFVQIVDTLQQTPLLGVAYVALIAACVAVAGWLVVANDVRAWAAAGLISVAVIIGYAFTRLIGTTFDNQDVGNWSCVLGLASLFVEGALLTMSGSAIALEHAKLKDCEPSIDMRLELVREESSSRQPRGAQLDGLELALSRWTQTSEGADSP
jgi:hypothetical protein